MKTRMPTIKVPIMLSPEKKENIEVEGFYGTSGSWWAKKTLLWSRVYVIYGMD